MANALQYAVSPLTEKIVHEGAITCLSNIRCPHEALATMRAFVTQRNMKRSEIKAFTIHHGVRSYIKAGILVEALVPVQQHERRKKSDKAIIDL